MRRSRRPLSDARCAPGALETCSSSWRALENSVELAQCRSRLGYAAFGEEPHDVADLLRVGPARAREANVSWERVAEGLLSDVGRQRKIRPLPRAQPRHRPRPLYPERDEADQPLIR